MGNDYYEGKGKKNWFFILVEINFFFWFNI